MKKHLNVSIDGLIREITLKKSEKAKNKLAECFMTAGESCGLQPYIYLIVELGKMKQKGRTCFCSDECDNVKSDGSCGGHE